MTCRRRCRHSSRAPAAKIECAEVQRAFTFVKKLDRRSCMRVVSLTSTRASCRRPFAFPNRGRLRRPWLQKHGAADVRRPSATTRQSRR